MNIYFSIMKLKVETAIAPSYLTNYIMDIMFDWFYSIEKILKLEMIDSFGLYYSLNSPGFAAATNANSEVPSIHYHFLFINFYGVSNIQ